MRIIAYSNDRVAEEDILADHSTRHGGRDLATRGRSWFYKRGWVNRERAQNPTTPRAKRAKCGRALGWIKGAIPSMNGSALRPGRDVSGTQILTTSNGCARGRGTPSSLSLGRV